MITTAPATVVREGFPALMPQNRAPGRHLSEITSSICAGLGDFDPDSNPPYQLMQLGLTMEWGLCQQLVHHHPGRYLRTWNEQYQCWQTGLQVTRDGIIGNIDLLNIGQEVVWAVEDVKLTRKSRKHPHDEIGNGIISWGSKWREAWLRVAGYCWMVGARVGRLWISHLFDYNERYGGDAYCVVVERRWDNPAGEAELAMRWDQILMHERGMQPKYAG